MRRAVSTWLAVCCLLCAAMVVVGGITRLTGSGLSIVEWAPLSGAIPPLSHEAWMSAFERYRATPEGTLIRGDLDLASFRALFLVEWAHRLLARVFGLVLVVPTVVFFRALPRRVAVAAALAIVQAVVGWLMVKSGLSDVPHVSPYRLVLHLMIGFAIFGLLFHEWLSREPVELPRSLVRASRSLVALIAVAAASGGAMAGTHGGLLFATFPDMNGAFVPGDVYARGPRSIFEDPLTAHFDHRLLALLVTAAALAFLARAWSTPLRGRALGLCLAVAAQITLGAATVILHVPIAIAVLHQLAGLIVFGASVAVLQGCRAADLDHGDVVVSAPRLIPRRE